MNTLGKESKTTILVIEYDKTSIEFTAAAEIRCGQPVKLTATGEITPWATADGLPKLIGYAYNEWDGVSPKKEVTVFTRGYMLIYGLTSAAAVAGLATYNTYDKVLVDNDRSQSGYSVYAAVADANADTANAWILDPTVSTTDLTRVLLKG